jgi:SAM-dependent methyltransferase
VKPDQDHFSPIASDYARGRFGYPETLYRFLAAHCREHHAAWDCATGSGQAARGLVERFSHVTATDISQELLARAPRHPRIVYRAAPAEASGLDPDSVDLVTVAQAVHWFDLPRFWTEVLRVLKPGGILAFWGYNWPVAAPRVDRVLEAFRETIVSAWPERSAILHEGYRSVRPPLDEIACPALGQRHTGTWPTIWLICGHGPLSATIARKLARTRSKHSRPHSLLPGLATGSSSAGRWP